MSKHKGDKIERGESMNCPVCGTEMKEIERYDVDIDICPQCKGVWLDRGEIDKIARAESSYSQDYERKPHKGKKKKGFLEDLLDF